MKTSEEIRIKELTNFIEDRKNLEFAVDYINNNYVKVAIVNHENRLYTSGSNTFNQILKNHTNAIIKEANEALKKINIEILSSLSKKSS